MSKKSRRVTPIGGFLYGLFSQHPEITIDSLAKSLNRSKVVVGKYFCTPGIKLKTLDRLLEAAFPVSMIYVVVWGKRISLRRIFELYYLVSPTRVGGHIPAEVLERVFNTNISAVKFVEILRTLDPECEIIVCIYTRNGGPNINRCECNLTNVIMHTRSRSIKSS